MLCSAPTKIKAGTITKGAQSLFFLYWSTPAYIKIPHIIDFIKTKPSGVESFAATRAVTNGAGDSINASAQPIALPIKINNKFGASLTELIYPTLPV